MKNSVILDVEKAEKTVSVIITEKENNDYSNDLEIGVKTDLQIVPNNNLDKHIPIKERKHQSNSARYGIISLLSLILIICVICLLTISSNIAIPKNDIIENNIERWDAKSASYSNFKHGFALSLPKDVSWRKISGSAKHTVVKFVQPDSKLTIFVNINKLSKDWAKKLATNDIWEIYEFFVNSVKKNVLPKVEANTSEKISRFLHKKVTICGKHAIKMKYNSVKEDDRYEDVVHITTLDYTFLHNNSTYTLSIKCYDNVLEELNKDGITLEDFAKSFQIIPIN